MQIRVFLTEDEFRTGNILEHTEPPVIEFHEYSDDMQGYWVKQANIADIDKLSQFSDEDKRFLTEVNRLTRAVFSYPKSERMIAMELKDTIELMQSEDYKERFKAEYLQTKIRLEKLHRLNIQQEAGTLKFKPKTYPGLLREQEEIMRRYLYQLELRAEFEGITL